MAHPKLFAAKQTVGEYGPPALLLLLALALRLLWRAHFMGGPGLDGAEHVDLAVGFSDGQGYEAVNGRYEGFVAPLFPLLVWAVSAFPLDIVTTTIGAGRAVSVVFGAMLVVPVYLIGERLYGRPTAVVAGCAVATHPLLVHLSAIARPDITCITLVMTAVYFQLRALRSDRKGLATAAGILYGFAVLTWPETVFTFAITTSAVAYADRQRWRLAATHVMAMLAGFAVIVAAGAALIVTSGGDVSPRMFAAAWNPLPFAAMLPMFWGLSLPLVLAFAVLGLLRSSSDLVAVHILLAVAVVSTVVALEVEAGSMGIVAGILPIALIWASRGVVEVGRMLTARLPRLAWMRLVGQMSVMAAAIGSIGLLSYGSLVERDGPTRLIWDSGWWLVSVDPAQKRMMDTSLNAAIHAGALFVPFPKTDSRSALERIANSHVDYLVVQRSHIDRRPYLREWFERGVPDRRARLVSNHASIPLTQEGRGDVLIYKWVQEDHETDAVASDAGDAESRIVQNQVETAPARGPLQVSSANPRYFADPSGEAVYLTGFHTWPSFQDAGRLEPFRRFDFDAYLSSLSAHRVNFVRLWVWEQADWVPWAPYHFLVAPLPYVRVGPGVALDGRPKFDLSRFDEQYFGRLRTRVRAAGERGVYVSVMLFQGFSVARKGGIGENPWKGHPFNRENNVNTIDGDPGETGEGLFVHTLGDRRILTFQEAYVEKVIDAVNDLDNVLFEICNECDGSSVEWQYHIIRRIKALESRRPKQHPVGMTVPYPGGHNSALESSPADWISPNTEGGYRTDPQPADGTKVVINDTDHLWGLGGDRSWVWKSFVRGLNPIFMDAYDHEWMYPPGGDSLKSQWEMVRRNMGYTADFAARMDLNSMVPRPDLCSPSFCLARPGGSTPEYLAYIPNGGPLSVDMRLAGRSTLEVEWLDPRTGRTSQRPAVQGGVVAEFVAPFDGDAVLHLFAQKRTAARAE